MKILIIINNFRIGGAERVAALLANHLSKEHEVHAMIGESEINYVINNEVKIHILSGENKPKFLKVPMKIYEARKLARFIQPDVILSLGNSSAMYGSICTLKNKLGNTILISSERTDPTREPRNKLMVIIRNWAYNRSDSLVCQTPWVKEYFTHKRIKANMVVIPNPIMPDLPRWEGTNSNTIITACRLEPQKNLPLLIDSFEMLHNDFPQMKLYIFGEGYLRNELMELICRKGLSGIIKMPGFSTDIHQEMRKARMYVSSSDYEGISNSMLEALGCGIPVVHTDCPVGGAAMFIKNGENGILVKPGDPRAIYEAMKTLIEHADLADKFSFNSPKIKYDLSIDRIVSLWTQLVNKSEHNL